MANPNIIRQDPISQGLSPEKFREKTIQTKVIVFQIAYFGKSCLPNVDIKPDRCGLLKFYKLLKKFPRNTEMRIRLRETLRLYRKAPTTCPPKPAHPFLLRRLGSTRKEQEQGIPDALSGPCPDGDSGLFVTGVVTQAAWAIEVVLGLYSLPKGMLPSMVGLEQPETAGLGRVSADSQAFAGDYLLSTNSGFGGVNSALILKMKKGGPFGPPFFM